MADGIKWKIFWIKEQLELRRVKTKLFNFSFNIASDCKT